MSAGAVRRHHYSRADLEGALRRAGVAAGDVLFSHVSMGMLGFPEEGATEQGMFETIYGAVRSVIGAGGTWMVPTYTYSFCRNQPFDPAATPSTVGPFTERFRKQPGTVRSREPIFSVAGVGPRAAEFLADGPRECFGADCLYDRLARARAKICNIGVGFRTVTYVHYTEQRLSVPYRFLKPFSGEMVVEGRSERQTWLYNVGVLNDATAPDLHALERMAAERGLFKTEPVGLGAVTVFGCDALDVLGEEALRADPWALARGPATDLVAAERERLGEPDPAVRVPADAGLGETVRALAPLPAHALSRAESASLDVLLRGLPARVRRFRSGTRAGSDVVPEAWRARGAALETVTGERLLSLEDHPFAVPYYSQKFAGEVSREELLAHLRPGARPGETPLAGLRGAQNWGLACPPELAARLTHPRYKVVIDALTAYAEAPVADVLAPGREPRELVLLARSDHGGLSNDGLSGAAVGAALMRRLLAGGSRRLGVRLVLAPGGFGPALHFAGAPAPEAVLVLGGLGTDDALAFQSTAGGPNGFEREAAAALKACGEPAALVRGDGPWLSAADLLFLPAATPAACLARAARPLDLQTPYDGFRTSREDAGFVSPVALERSLSALRALVEALAR